jgi:hypothetical protein
LFRKERQKESHERSFSSLQTGIGLRGLIHQQNRGLPLVAAGVPVLVMLVVMGVLMGVLMGVSLGLVAMLMAVVAMGFRLVRVLMLMLVFAVAAHRLSLLSCLFKI